MRRYLMIAPVQALIACVSLILLPATLEAEVRSADEVRLAVETWVRGETADAKPDAFVEKMEPYIVNGVTVAYIAHLAGGGFCLCGADDRLLPVYFYSPDGEGSLDNPGCRLVLGQIANRAEALQKEGVFADGLAGVAPGLSADRAAYWDGLIGGENHRSALASVPEEVVLPLTSNWHQNSPYNDQCPLIDSQRALVGCGAIAAAQIMYYWKWPLQGEGSDFPVNFANQTYNWSVIPDEFTSQAPGTAAGRAEVAKLCYHTAQACDTSWGLDASTTFIWDVSDALQSHFRYDNDASWGFWWDNHAVEEIRFSRPVVRTGWTPDSAHMCVVYGFRQGTQLQFLLNLGWGNSPTAGFLNGWHTIDDVFTGVVDGEITGIAPREGVKFVGCGEPGDGDGSPDDPYGSLLDAENLAPPGTRLILRANTAYSVGSAGLTLRHLMLLNVPGIVIQR